VPRGPFTVIVSVDNLGQQRLSRATPGRRPPGTRKHSPGLPPKWRTEIVVVAHTNSVVSTVCRRTPSAGLP